MKNDPGWQRRSDDWVKMLDQSRLRKEKRLKDQVKMPDVQSVDEVVTGIDRRDNHQSPEQ